jgi:hypothetical protein
VDFSHRFKRKKGIILREEGDGAFLFDPETGNLKYMNQSAREAYLMINGRKDIKQIIQQLLGLYPEADLRQISEDVQNFFKELEDNKFISSSKDS